ncbi:SDR family oxidoreductase [Intestinirhabdus alba]|jgi:nucleoside-diphosphate-sugar epimerase|uniref:NAD-dependent epimerase/dehydratase family protein n=1 Tax=Intestinirhabdus alba TaxID=2899544 RepID=A0A6L6INT7_9ENTR|nr:SDR family oxidoreductase [Intestinirhabdus alba]MTH47196.1 NAD-dependent epimerase/dehydratase family protein [Intestinirhabdus alba]
MSSLLITGATGFLSGAVLAKALSENAFDHYLLLVRASSAEEGLSRIKENLQRFACDEKSLSSLSLQNIIIGDLAEPDRFLNDERLLEVTHVINAAAVASFGENALIWKVNVEGTLKFARRMANVRKLKRFLHVGTAMSCIPEAGALVTESITHKEEEEHLVQYTWSKSSIEQLMLEQCPALPLVIARPSIVVGHSSLGCRPSSSIFWVFRMALMLGKFMCSLGDKIDVIPVDYCAEALLMLVKRRTVEERVYHVSAGDERSVSFAEIDRAIADALGQPPLSSDYRQVDYEDLIQCRREFKTIYGPCNERLMLRAMRLYGEFSRLNVRFSNKKLLGLGMPHPPRFVDYIRHCVETTRGTSIPEMMKVDFK